MEIIGVRTKGLHSCRAGGRLHGRYSTKFQVYTFIGSRNNAGVQKVKWGHVTRERSQFVVLSLCPSKMISAVLDV